MDSGNVVFLFFPDFRSVTNHILTKIIWLFAELWLAPLQLVRATSAATFPVAPGLAPLLFKIANAATSAASILTTFRRCANR